MTRAESRIDWPLVGLLLAVCVVNVVSMPALRYDGDAGAWEMEAESLVYSGRLAVPRAIIEQNPKTAHYFALNPESGQYYSKYGIGNTLLYALPLLFERALLDAPIPTDPSSVFGRQGAPYRITRRVELLNAFNVLASLLLATILYRLASLYTGDGRVRVGFVLACFYSTFLWNYLRAQTTELFQCLLFSSALLFLLRFARDQVCETGADRQPRPPSRALLWSALALGGLCLVKLAYVALVPVWVIAVVLAGTRESTGGVLGALGSIWSERVRYALYGALPIVFLFAVILVANELRFGDPFKLGYERETNLFGAKLSESVPGYLLSARYSVFVHFPVLLIAAFGIHTFWRTARYELLVTWALFLTMFAVNSSYYYWKGEACYGPRYLVFGLPALALPFVAVLESIARQRGALRKCVPLGATLILLGYASYLQTRVNALEFHAYYRFKAALIGAKVGDREASRYLAYTNTALIHRDLIAYRDSGSIPIPMRQAQHEFGPKRFSALEARVLENLDPNYYWHGRR